MVGIAQLNHTLKLSLVKKSYFLENPLDKHYKKVYNIIVMEAYRSGHNGPDSKSGSPHGLVGSNPTASAKKA